MSKLMADVKVCTCMSMSLGNRILENNSTCLVYFGNKLAVQVNCV